MKEPKEEAERIKLQYIMNTDIIGEPDYVRKIVTQCAALHVEGIIEETDSPSYWQEVLQIIKDK